MYKSLILPIVILQQHIYTLDGNWNCFFGPDFYILTFLLPTGNYWFGSRFAESHFS